ncbi:hypothetical protein IWQ47_000224 [Aquimarina sp. EL_43]|uniref:hypothetical protein n=1 Tax=unclassified Aquimarina TaxID=2627091 RepID=UPI0018CA5C65|nr:MULTISPECIES: hypothetical protein [unclassified Aquimarina]MBG6129084.1 hypothetical protein [Aquimarina sp. EL_35]MBG6150149.1 hypothetical protein [Aquimarina sp. EL_32]MBG6167166.1 hypothetical protein [Aquimarina sp. EL_43]
MKYLNITKFVLIACFTLVIISCQEEDQDIQEDTITNDISEVEEIDLATFNFSNGISLTMSKGYEESDPYIATLESGPNDTKMFIDFKNNSMLKVYLSLTPEGTPVPKALLDFASSDEKTKVSSNRPVVEKLDHSVFSIAKFPTKLMTTTNLNIETKAFCDSHQGAEQCYNSKFGSKRYQSSATWKYIQMYTSVFHDSNGSITAHLTYGKNKTKQKEHTIQPGWWARKTTNSSWARRRGSYRFAPFGEHWKGYTDVHN